MPPEPISILAHTQHSYAEAMRAALGKGYDHASILYSEWCRTGAVTAQHPAFDNAKTLLETILNATDFTRPAVSQRHQQDLTEKFAISLQDGYVVEAVAIPMKFGWSLCVSSQVGCRMGCTFCQTGKMGLWRNLTVQEIVCQLFIARFELGYDIRNVVFMGMGEPMDNFDAVKKAIEIMTDKGGFGLAQSHMTISTSGRVDGIRRLMHECDPAINLAVSVNAPNDAIRTKIMPINRKHDMSELKQVLEEYCAHPRRSILAEYVMLKGITDSLEAADQLAEYLKGLKVKVNLIPYNPQKPDRYAPPEPDALEAFAVRMREKGYQTLLRRTKGSQIMAACGQLGSGKRIPITA